MLSKKMGKELTCRDIKDEYHLLRELNRMYDAEDSAHTSVKCQIYFLLQRLFCDCSFKEDFLYTLTGRVVVEQYHASPYRILGSGYKRFCAKMKNMPPG